MNADDLFALPPEDFVAARDDLAKRLRAQGDRQEAARVRRLRRPNVPAWAVDQLARRHAADLEGLLEAGSLLRAAQEEALAGHGGGLRAATARRRDLIDRLTERASEILAASGRDPAAHRAAIAATLEAATVDDDAAATLRAGTLTKELASPAGFGDLAAFAPAPAAQTEQERGAQAELERAARADERIHAADRAAAQAREEAEEAAAEVSRLETQLAEARRTAAAADERAVQAASAAQRARTGQDG